MIPLSDDVPLFGQAISGTKHKGRNINKGHATDLRMVDAAKKADPLSAAIGAYKGRLRKRLDAEAQHGPVKVLWKDGKPVGAP